MAELLYGIRAVTTAETTFTWVDTDFVIDAGLRPYGEMPVWRPARDGAEGFARFDLTPEVEKGLTFRSLADTTTATLEFHFSADGRAAGLRCSTGSAPSGRPRCWRCGMRRSGGSRGPGGARRGPTRSCNGHGM